jgi:hypothetical protein
LTLLSCAARIDIAPLARQGVPTWSQNWRKSDNLPFQNLSGSSDLLPGGIYFYNTTGSDEVVAPNP